MCGDGFPWAIGMASVPDRQGEGREHCREISPDPLAVGLEDIPGPRAGEEVASSGKDRAADAIEESVRGIGRDVLANISRPARRTAVGVPDGDWAEGKWPHPRAWSEVPPMHAPAIPSPRGPHHRRHVRHFRGACGGSKRPVRRRGSLWRPRPVARGRRVGFAGISQHRCLALFLYTFWGSSVYFARPCPGPVGWGRGGGLG